VPGAGTSTAVPREGGRVSPPDAAHLEAGVAEDSRAAELWAAAAEGNGDADDLARLASYVGEEGLIAGAIASRRRAALRALAFTDLTALPFLADVASLPSDADATDALESVVTLLDAERRATDPEDALELRSGTSALIVLAKDKTKSPGRRTLAVNALRRLADRGLVPAADVPADLDSH
jgi:hypothetical protein